MIRIFSNIIPFKGFLAMTVWPFVFIRKELKRKYNETTDRHEHIHAEQQKEVLLAAIMLACITFGCTGSWLALLWLPLYLYLYLTEWLLRTIFGNGDAYLNISFEKEAYKHESDPNYIQNRHPFAWISILILPD